MPHCATITLLNSKSCLINWEIQTNGSWTLCCVCLRDKEPSVISKWSQTALQWYCLLGAAPSPAGISIPIPHDIYRKPVVGGRWSGSTYTQRPAPLQGLMIPLSGGQEEMSEPTQNEATRTFSNRYRLDRERVRGWRKRGAFEPHWSQGGAKTCLCWLSDTWFVCGQHVQSGFLVDCVCCVPIWFWWSLSLVLRLCCSLLTDLHCSFILKYSSLRERRREGGRERDDGRNRVQKRTTESLE